MSKWENTRIGKLTGGLFGNHNEMCRIINIIPMCYRNVAKELGSLKKR